MVNTNGNGTPMGGKMLLKTGDTFDRQITVWEFRSVDGKQVVQKVYPAHVDDELYQHYYQRIVYTGPESKYTVQSR